MRELVVVRHGQTPWNAVRRFQGHTDVPLDEVGRWQARGLAALLASETFDRAVSSDLVRAAETARLALGARTLSLRLDAGWREMRFGDWEGLTWPQIVAAHPEFDEANETKPRTYTPDGGESFDELCARVKDAVARLAADLPADGRAFVATHAGPLHALVRVLGGESDAAAREVRFVPASVSRFVETPDGWRIASLNRTAGRPEPRTTAR